MGCCGKVPSTVQPGGNVASYRVVDIDSGDQIYETDSKRAKR